MKFEEFKEKITELKRDYRAVCYSKNSHWNGTWRQTYSEAYEDVQKHMNSSPGNELHKIKIVERVYSETAIV
ncbi:hypothetical protein [Flavobacterium sp. CAN_S2]|uniref:hypothetical protein n=1 Tax=Flavobacterium sp. CAN_S2 TaxID=2787726 RepID=UPI0018CB36B5